MSDLFAAFKHETTDREPRPLPKSIDCVLEAGPGDPRLILRAEENVIDPPSPRSYAGAWRDLLGALEEISLQDRLRLDWENEGEGFSLSRYPYLLPLALETGALILPGGTPVRLLEERIELRIDGPGPFSARLTDGEGENLRYPIGISPGFILDKERLYRVPPLGDGYRSLKHLGTLVREEELPRFLSLARTHFPGLPLRFKEYRVVRAEEEKLQEGLIFSEIDRDGFLKLRLCLAYPGYPPDFFTAYDAAEAVEIDHGSERIVCRPTLAPDLGRSLKRIRSAILRIQKALDQADGFFIDGTRMSLAPRLAERFLEEELPSLAKRFMLFGTEHLARYRFAPSRPKLSLRLSGGGDILRGECRVELNGESFAPQELIELHRESRFIALNDGRRTMVDDQFIRRLTRILKSINNEEVTLSFFDLPLIQEMLDEQIAGPGSLEPAKIYRGFEELESKPAPVPSINGTLREYQESGYRWLYYLHRIGLGGCLADDMGLGKTVQTISLLATVYSSPGAPSLIILPKSLIFNWQGELARFAPQLSVASYYGPDRDLESAMEHNIILTTYTVVRNDIAALRKHRFRYLILDEAQNIKNLGSRITRASLLLEAEHRLAISGTPMENNLMELYSLFRFLNPGMFGTAKEFQRLYANPIQKEHCQVTAEDLRRKISPFLLRRLKTEVAKDLPEKSEQILYVEMEEEQRRLYEARREYFSKSVREKVEKEGLAESQIYILQAISELRQIATVPESRSSGLVESPKRELLRQSLADVFAIGHKAVIFSNFLGSLEHLSSDLEGMGVRHLFLTGATRDRREVVERFQQEEENRALLMTLKTGGVGLNLTVADYVYLLDPWWNIAAENQAVDRCHRIGQKNTVFAYKLIAKESIEERIVELQERKRELFQAVISADSGMMKSFSRDDIDFMLS